MNLSFSFHSPLAVIYWFRDFIFLSLLKGFLFDSFSSSVIPLAFPSSGHVFSNSIPLLLPLLLSFLISSYSITVPLAVYYLPFTIPPLLISPSFLFLFYSISPAEGYIKVFFISLLGHKRECILYFPF